MMNQTRTLTLDDLSEKELMDMLIGFDHRKETLSRFQWKNNWTYGAWIVALLFLIISLDILPFNYYTPKWALANSLLWSVNSAIFAHLHYRKKIINLDSAYFTIGMEIDERHFNH